MNKFENCYKIYVLGALERQHNTGYIWQNLDIFKPKIFIQNSFSVI